MNTKYLLAALIAVVSTSTMFGFKVRVNNRTGEAITVETKPYAALSSKEVGKPRSTQLAKGSHFEENFGLNNTAYVQFMYQGKLYRIDTKGFVKNIIVSIFPGAGYSINAESAGQAKKI